MRYPPVADRVTPYDTSGLFLVECYDVCPRIREYFHSFDAAYSHANEVASNNLVQVDIAYGAKYQMSVRPNREVRFWNT